MDQHAYLSDAQRTEFEALTRPLMKWLCENCNPHCEIVVEPTGARLYGGHDYHTGQINDYVRD